jgi:hypothetical protein
MRILSGRAIREECMQGIRVIGGGRAGSSTVERGSDKARWRASVQEQSKSGVR